MNELLDGHSALLFDLDGTLIDTMPLHYRAYAEVFARHGLILRQADFQAAIGGPAAEAIPRFLASLGVENVSAADVLAIHQEKKDAFDGLLAQSSPARLPAAELLDRARGAKKIALVSSGNRRGVTAILASVGWENVFDIVISGDDVVRGKPDPEGYRKAAAALNVRPDECLVIEDTDAGLTSGRAAGMAVLDVALLAAQS
ncbi:MAG: HAD family phosphatase [Bradyrhizobium sp.]|nr:HAD family phosphatase [Bradyrhizobium sp.]